MRRPGALAVQERGLRPRQRRDAARGKGQTIQVVSAAAVRIEKQLCPVGRIGRRPVLGVRLGQLDQCASFQIELEDLIGAGAVGGKRQAQPIRSKSREAILTLAIGQSCLCA